MKVLRIMLGGLFVLIGLAGLAMPLMPGWPFLIFGITMLAREIPWVRQKTRRILIRIALRFPRLYIFGFHLRSAVKKVIRKFLAAIRVKKIPKDSTGKACYCVCHSSFSSNAFCEHCRGDNEVGRKLMRHIGGDKGS